MHLVVLGIYDRAPTWGPVTALFHLSLRTCKGLNHGKKRTRNKPQDRLIVGISGASGVVYGIRLLEALTELGWNPTW